MAKTTSINLLEKAFNLSLSNIWRNKFLSIATIFVIGTIIFIFNVILAVNFIAQDALTDLSKKIDIIVYIKDGANYEGIESLKNDIQKLEGVNEIKYTSKENALEQIKTTHPDISLAFEKYKLGNPLPASLNVSTIHPRYHSQIATFLKSEAKYKLILSKIVTNDSEGKDSILTSVSQNLLELTNFARQIIFWLITIFIIGGTLIILNALQITIFNRKKEISVMKLVGASHWFIRLPFIIESIIYGLLAVIISFIMLLALSQKIQIQETNLFNYYSDIKFYKIFAVEIIATISLSIISSMFAVHEYLNKKLIEH